VTPGRNYLTPGRELCDSSAIQRYFAQDPVSWAAHTYLSMERMSLN
jgi:hypothetical protein